MLVLKHISSRTIRTFVAGGFLEFGPIIVFLAAYDLFHIYKATFLLMIATIVAIVLTFHFQQRLPYAGLYVAFLTMLFGYLTLWHHNPEFIQIRDTAYDFINASVLLVGLFFNTLLFKHAFDHALPMTDRAWRNMTYAWIVFFFTAAFMNEFVRHAYSLDAWMIYKTTMAILTTVYGFATFFIFYEKKEAIDAV